MQCDAASAGREGISTGGHLPQELSIACSDTQLQAARRARATLTVSVTHCFIFYSSFVPSFFFVCSLFRSFLLVLLYFIISFSIYFYFAFFKVFHLIPSLYVCLVGGSSIFIVSDLLPNCSIYHFSFTSVSLPSLCRTSERQTIKCLYSGIHCTLSPHLFSPWRKSPPVGQGLLIIETSQSHSDTSYSVGLLWTIDQPDPVTCTCTSHNSHKRQTSIPTAGFELAIVASERPQTHALEGTVTFRRLTVIIRG